MTRNDLNEASAEGASPAGHPDPAGDPDAAVTWPGGRAVGPWGTTVRLVAGTLGIAWGVAVPHEHPLLALPGAGSDVVGLLVGLVGVPAASTLAVLARGRDAPRLQAGRGTASLVALLTLAVALCYPVAALVAVGAPLLLLAAVGRTGCELLAVPNLVLGRDDYLFCVPFSPVDAWERRRRHAERAQQERAQQARAQ